MKTLIPLLTFLSFSLFAQVENFDKYTIEWSSEGVQYCTYRLTSEMVKNTKTRKRPNFSSYKDITPKNYTNSGYDRGHLAPAFTFSQNKDDYYDTFVMANIIPQSPFINRGLWKYVEEYERELALSEKCLLIHIEVHYDEDLGNVGSVKIPSAYTRTIRDCNFQEIGKFYIRNIQKHEIES